MNLLPIELGLASKTGVKPMPKEQFAELAKKHKYRCGYCSFLAMGALKPAYCESKKKWAPACPLCYDAINLDQAETSRPSANMIAIEGVSQGAINSMIHTHWMLQEYTDDCYKPTKEGLAMMLSKFEVAVNSMRNTYGKDANELEVFVSVLENIPPQRYARRSKVIAPVRYFNPSEEDYKIEIEYWRRSTYSRLIEGVNQELRAE